jgi:hypothetical protein
VRGIDVAFHIRNPDLRATEAGRSAFRHLRRQLEARIPHGVLPLIESAVAPVCFEISLRELGEQPLPCHVEGGACRVERLGGRARAQAAIGRRIEADAPAPLVLVGRHASALADAPDTDVVVIDRPSLLIGVGITAAGEGGCDRAVLLPARRDGQFNW